MGLIALVAGLILDLAGKTWFTGAQHVGVVLIWVGVVLLALQLLWMLCVGAFIKNRWW